MASIQAWVIRIWSRVIRTSDQAPGFFYRYAKWLDFLTEASLTSFLISFSKTTQFFFLSELQFSKNRQSEFFFFNLESISGQTDDISQQTENKNNYREISSGDRTRKTGGIFFSVDRTQSPKMMVILESQLFSISRYRNRWSFNFRSGIIYRFILLRFGLEFDVIQNYKLENEPVSTEEFMVIDL